MAKKVGLEDGFEGNAQSFRIVTRLAVYRSHVNGLNLTRATLNAILKYPWTRKPDVHDKHHWKWNAYKTEQEVFEWARQGAGVDGETRTIEAELMDWADDIAYSVHDLEDFYIAGLIPLDRMASSKEERICFLERAEERAQKRNLPWAKGQKKSFRECLDFLVLGLFDWLGSSGNSLERNAVNLIVTPLIRRYVRGVSLQWGEHNVPAIHIPREHRREIEILKELTWQYVIDTPSLSSHQYGQQKIIRVLFDIYETAIKEERFEMLPLHARGWLEQLKRTGKDWNSEKTRVVIDLIASMTESQAISMYQRLTGVDLGSALRSPVM